MVEKKSISFEEALRELEDIAEKLERGTLSLEDSIKAYERGMELKKVCSERLVDAEAKIEFLSKAPSGEIVKSAVKKKKEDGPSKPVEEDLF
ncbi:exodeoxyribonuclease VII, small subunit [Leptospira wolbachii serovar Codice str. CDC]|uniref:Exodeoxyribonuclease 7 small subunit n=3 Tax=Leptospira TaxID=171 RepID=R9A7Z6_9LEPT|nr:MULTISPECIES: exodeoxyribonuclease VII small subunit [Leptospira]EMY69526.1 exodeoxyribonuclease VII, small subunit [Leptospira vanthielii serovar Holland str. Waz Holland = ATCC 700522]EOQ98237.1 exodeoxyribonuclease VII, small subunit [Leptospira wolbachii serovar Codice str. CDC]MBM9547152.1 exodeoxyribonuclease VII small subunit [Leptospira abararensis]TGM51474.1 exodeoxyribonuclease VII small subunit [Leptospira vanthielii]